MKYKKVLELKKRFSYIKINDELLKKRKEEELYPGDRVYVFLKTYFKKGTIVGYDKKKNRWLVNFDNEKKGSFEYFPDSKVLIFDTAIRENCRDDFEKIVWDTLNY